MGRSTSPKHFLTAEESRSVSDAVREAELHTSAEIKLLVVRHCWGDIRNKAKVLFHKHKLDRTELHNAVLILMVVANREFLIYGDTGINEKVGADFWVEVRDVMSERFKADAMGEGLCSGIAMVGEKLKGYFPRQVDDRNEISDEVGYDE